MAAAKLKWSADEVMGFLEREFSQVFRDGRQYLIDELSPGLARVRMPATEASLRPGDIVSGPALMELTDLSVYMLLLGLHGQSARLAVTTNLQISFLRRAVAGDVVCAVEIVKHGRTLSVADCRITSLADGKLVAQAQTTYFMGGAD